MRMVQRTLFGCAAALFGAVGAQAADLPVKAKPVEYVKVCSLYGVGFYYIPGTDTCIKLGGYVRADYYVNNSGGDPFIIDSRTRGSTEFRFRARATVSADVRSQTAYGVLRSYFLGGWTNTDGGTSAYFARAFIQFAGFTFGLASASFFDIWDPPGNITSYNSMGMGSPGQLVFGYTAQFGNGVSATIAIEYPRVRGVIDLTETPAPWTLAGALTTDTAGAKVPDIVGNLRIDQSWGYLMVSVAAHLVAANYFGADVVTAGGPSDAWGWAVAFGGQFNVTSSDTVGAQVAFSRGASMYATSIAYLGFAVFDSNTSLGVAWASDGVFAAPGAIAGYTGAIQLTETWGFIAGWEHKWSSEFRTSLFGGYSAYDYGATATALICAGATGGIVAIAALTNCNPDFSLWSIGTRLRWDPVSNLTFAADFIYHHLNTAHAGLGTLTAVTVQRPVGVYRIEDQHVLAFMFRAQRSFYP